MNCVTNFKTVLAATIIVVAVFRTSPAQSQIAEVRFKPMSVQKLVNELMVYNGTAKAKRFKDFASAMLIYLGNDVHIDTWKPSGLVVYRKERDKLVIGAYCEVERSYPNRNGLTQLGEMPWASVSPLYEDHQYQVTFTGRSDFKFFSGLKMDKYLLFAKTRDELNFLLEKFEPRPAWPKGNSIVSAYVDVDRILGHHRATLVALAKTMMPSNLGIRLPQDLEGGLVPLAKKVNQTVPKWISWMFSHAMEDVERLEVELKRDPRQSLSLEVGARFKVDSQFAAQVNRLGAVPSRFDSQLEDAELGIVCRVPVPEPIRAFVTEALDPESYEFDSVSDRSQARKEFQLILPTLESETLDFCYLNVNDRRNPESFSTAIAVEFKNAKLAEQYLQQLMRENGRQIHMTRRDVSGGSLYQFVGSDSESIGNLKGINNQLRSRILQADYQSAGIGQSVVIIGTKRESAELVQNILKPQPRLPGRTPPVRVKYSLSERIVPHLEMLPADVDHARAQQSLVKKMRADGRITGNKDAIELSLDGFDDVLTLKLTADENFLKFLACLGEGNSLRPESN